MLAVGKTACRPNKKGQITMINFESINAYNCQPENEFTRWAKDENMAYCEGFAALCAEQKQQNRKLHHRNPYFNFEINHLS